MKKPFLTRDQAESIAASYPTPFHIYDEKGIRENARRVKEAFSWNPGFKEYFAVKATPTPGILKVLKEEGCGVDCSSLTELMMSEKCGFSGSDIMFSSNETPPEEYELAHRLGAVINLDDITHINFLKDTIGEIPETISCRLNPGGVFQLSSSEEGFQVMDSPQDAKYGFTREQLTEGVKKLMQKGVKKFVYASSSSVYGDEPNLPKKEGREGDLLSPYAVSKRADEEWAKQYTKHYGLDTYGLRYFNVFGRRQDPNGAYAAVIPKFIRQLLHGEVPTINGDGKQSRDFTYIENVIEANLKACLADSDAAGQAYNIAYGGREYLLDIYYGLVDALGIKDENGNRLEPNFGPDRAGDIKHSNADISKAKELLGYDPEWSFDRGIKAAIEWYRENL